MAVYRCLDYYTGWFNNVSMRQVWEFLGFNFSELFLERVEECNTKDIAFYTKYSKNPRMTHGFFFNNVYVGLDFPDFYKAWLRHSSDDDSDRLKICDEPGRVYVTLSGSALEYVRSINPDIDKMLCRPADYLSINTLLQERAEKNGRSVSPDELKPFVELTRADFAFDFINEHNDIYSQFFNYCVWLDKMGRGRTCGPDSTASKYSARFNDQRTVYFGNSNTRLLRCYDKMYQIAPKGVITDAREFPYREDIPINEVQSWQRIEYQTRTQYAVEAMAYLEHQEDLRDVWSLVCKHFDFLVPDDVKPRSEWKRLEICERIFNVDFIPHIILNNHNNQSALRPIDKAERAVDRVLSSVVGLIGVYGLNGFVELINSKIKSMQENELDSPLVALRLQRQQLKILEILEDYGVSLADSCLEQDPNGNFYVPNLFDSDGQYIDLTKLENYISEQKWFENQSYKAVKNENRSLTRDLDFYKLFFENLKRQYGMEFSPDMKDALYNTVSHLGYRPSELR